MSNRTALLGLIAAAAMAAPSGAAFAKNARPGIDVSCCSTKTLEAYPGDDVDGRRIRPYVFVYADLNNDGVLRGKELRRAKDRAIREERGSDRFR